jgi:ankyrin repeat protein
MATTPLNVSLSDSKPQTEAQGAGIEMQARVPAVDTDDAPVGSSDVAAGLADAQVQPSVSVASESPGPTPSDAAEAEKRMLEAIGGALEQGPRAVVDAMWMALPRGEAYDKIYKLKHWFEELPISAACAMDQSLAVISKLMEAFPDHVRKKGDNGCMMDQSISLGQSSLNNFNINSKFKQNFKLMKAFPDGDESGHARKEDEDGWTAINWAARNISNAAVISELLKAYPEAACEKDKKGRLPLHLAARNNSNAAVILELLKAYPEAAREKDAGGNLPLHVAAKCNPNAVVISELLKAYPEAAREKDKYGTLPLRGALHVTVIRDISVVDVAVISELLKAYPEAAREKDEKGRVPLHVAVENNSNVAVILELLKAYPEAAREKDAGGNLPLHFAARYNSNAVVISELLKAYPEAAREKNEYGRLPLHAAFGKSLHEESHLASSSVIISLSLLNFKTDAAVILELLKAYPEAAREKDSDGCLALHFYTRKNSDAAVISELLKACPDAVVLVVDDETNPKATLNKCLPALSHTGDLPCSMIKNSTHPLQACIRLSAELMAFSRSQRSKDIRLANGADEKAAELEQLACAIARSCEDSSLFGQAMDDCLQLAADLKLKFFISEPACSSRVEQLWLKWSSNFATWEEKLFSLVYFLFLISGLNFVFIHAPPPLVRFLMNRASYLAFLVCLLQLPVLPAPGHPVDNLGLEVFLAYWLFDICFSEAAELLDIMRKHRLTAFKAVAKYAEDPWNVYDVVTLSTAVAAAFIRGFVYAGVGDATAAASNQLYAWALALLWGRLVNVLSVVSFIGPLLIMVLAMVFRDLSKFAFLVVLMELPFVAALYFLESGDGGNEAFATFPDSALSFFKIVIGQGPDVSSVTASSSVLLSVGSVLLSVLLLNLLIAMFSKTFDTIVENSTQEYLLQKAQLTFTWVRAPRMPPPLACALALRDWAMKMVARHVWHNEIFRGCCAGWDRVFTTEDGWKYEERVEPSAPTFDKEHFYEILFLQKIDWDTKQEHAKNPAKREEWTAQWMQECDAKYEAWCEQVLADLEENAEFNSEAQMDKFKSRMLRGMETTVESSGKIDKIAENAKATQEQVKATQEQVNSIQEQGKATQEQVKALSDAVQSHATQEQVKALSDAVQQMHASMQLILQKLNP